MDQTISPSVRPSHRWSGRLLFPLLVLAGLVWAARVVTVETVVWEVEEGPPQAPAPALPQGEFYGQALERPAGPGRLDQIALDHLDLTFGTYLRRPAGLVRLTLLRGAKPPAGLAEVGRRRLAETSLDAALLPDSAPQRWDLGGLSLPQEGLYLLVERQGDPAGTPLTIWLAGPVQGRPPAQLLAARAGGRLEAAPLTGPVVAAWGLSGGETAWARLNNRPVAWGLLGLGLGALALAGLLAWTRRRAELALVAASLALPLAAAELGIRLYAGQVLTTANFVLQEQARLRAIYPLVLDPELGHLPWPGWHMVDGQALTILELGLRGGGSGRARPERPLVLCLGDSFTFGAEVSDAETWPAYLEELVPARVVNGGVFGYGLDQIVLRAERLVPLLKPDLLLVGLIPDDIGRCGLSLRTGLPKPYFTIEEGRLKLHPPRPASPTRSLGLVRRWGGHSLLIHQVMMALAPEAWLLGSSGEAESTRRVHGYAEEVACRLLDRLKALSSSVQVSLILLYGKDDRP
jgi:hypothetical protein